MSQRRSNRTNVEEDDPNLESSIKECVRFIICREGNKIPIKRAEIAKHLNSTCQTASNQISKCIIEANKILKTVYGYKMLEVEAKSSVQYILVLSDECESLPGTALDPDQRRLLVAALLHIFMSGGNVKEDDMWRFLTEAGLLEEEHHAGRKVLTNTFTKQLYLSYYKVGEGDFAKNVFGWGQRATEEMPKLFLLNKMAQAFDKQPDHWYEQYRAATIESAGETE